MDRQEDEENNGYVYDYCILCIEGSENEELITPCGCVGAAGMQYYHYSCLIKFMQLNHDKPCTRCGQRYMDSRIRRRNTRWYHWFLSPHFIGSMGWFLGFLLLLYLFFRLIDSKRDKISNRGMVYIMFLYSMFSVFAFITIVFLMLWFGIDHYNQWYDRYRSGFVDFTIDGPNGTTTVTTLDVTYVENLNKQIEDLTDENLSYERAMANYNEDWDQKINDWFRNIDEEGSEYTTADEGDRSDDEYHDALEDQNQNMDPRYLNDLRKRKEENAIESAEILSLIENLTERIEEFEDQEAVQQTIDELLKRLEELKEN